MREEAGNRFEKNARKARRNIPMKKREIYGGSGRGEISLKSGSLPFKADSFGMYALGNKREKKVFN